MNNKFDINIFKKKITKYSDLPELTNPICTFKNIDYKNAERDIRNTKPGELNFTYNGHFRRIDIKYYGNISIDVDFEFPENHKILIFYKTNRIIIRNTNPYKNMENDILFTYYGEIEKLGIVNVYGYNNILKRAKVIQRNEYINENTSDTLIQNDTTELRSSIDENDFGASSSSALNYQGYSKRKRYKKIKYVKQKEQISPAYRDKKFIKEKEKNNFSDTSFTNYRSRLPENYNYTLNKSKYCGNCHFLIRGKFCNLWRAPIRTNFTCNSWLKHSATKNELDNWSEIFKKNEEHHNIDYIMPDDVKNDET